MIALYARPVSRAATWSRRTGFFGLMLLAASIGFQHAGFMQTPSFAAVVVMCAALAVVALGFGIVGLWRLWSVGAKGGRSAFAGVLCAAFVLGPITYAALRYAAYPPIYDVTTDRVDPPLIEAQPVGAANWTQIFSRLDPRVAEPDPLAYPNISGRRYEGAIDRVLTAVRIVAERRGVELDGLPAAPVPPEEPGVGPDAGGALIPGGQQVPEDAPDAPPRIPIPVPAPRPDVDPGLGPVVELQPSDLVLGGRLRDPVFGFPSVVSIRLEEEAETTFVDMRAVSRFAHHDLGTNQRAVEGFLRALDAELFGVAEAP